MQADAPADPPATTELQPTLRQRYRYCNTSAPQRDVEDQDAIQRHLDEMAASGWELVSANGVQWLSIRTTRASPSVAALVDTHSTSFAQHFFYWRQAV